MTRPSSAEMTKPQKRKGSRSVSTLTPSQLARKRANDREAQRAIRARTKEHIERLETELEELKKSSRYSRDETVQDLIRKNKALEREILALRESLHTRSGLYSKTGHDNTESGLSSRPSSSYDQGCAEYSPASSYGDSCLPTPEPCESWASVVSVSAVSVPSVVSVSSPSSSVGNPDEYMPGYIPTSVPSHMMDNLDMSRPGMSCVDGTDIDYDDMESEYGYSQIHVPHSSPNYIHQQPWPMYSAAYYPESPTL